MDLKVVFPGGTKVDVLYKGFTISTDQPAKAGGNNEAPSPFDLFLASIAACSGYYVLSFCQRREIDTAGIELVVDPRRNSETGMVESIGIAILLPEDFPGQYTEAVVRAAEQCTVKKHLAKPPEFEIKSETKKGR